MDVAFREADLVEALSEKAGHRHPGGGGPNFLRRGRPGCGRNLGRSGSSHSHKEVEAPQDPPEAQEEKRKKLGRPGIFHFFDLYFAFSIRTVQEPAWRVIFFFL